MFLDFGYETEANKYRFVEISTRKNMSYLTGHSDIVRSVEISC